MSDAPGPIALKNRKFKMKRLNVTFTNSSVDEVEQLRSLLEKRLSVRLPIVEVLRQLVKEALIKEQDLVS